MYLSNIFVSLRLGVFLAVRQIRRSRLGTTMLIVFIMMLTFLNFIVIRGVLVGLVVSTTSMYKERFFGDVIVSTLPNKNFIENSPFIEKTISNLPWVSSYSPRYLKVGSIEGGYKERIDYRDKPNMAVAVIAGIDPSLENQTTGLSKSIIKGEYLDIEDDDYVLVGANLLKQYLPIEAPGLATLKDVDVGSKVRIVVGGNTKEMTVKGVVNSKVQDVDQRIFVTNRTMRRLMEKTDYNVGEISIKLNPGTDPILVKNALQKAGWEGVSKIQTSKEALPKYIKDIGSTFNLLGDILGSISLVVAFISIFIVIYINAISRRKYIGILKAIGINSVAIEFAYILQSIFYACVGIGFGMVFLYFFIIPYVNANPINFPFSDGTIIAEYSSTFVRALLLICVTVLAGYIPARLVVKQNTLDAILGR